MSEDNQKKINDLYTFIKSKEIITEDDKKIIQKTYLDTLLTDKTISEDVKKQIVGDVEKSTLVKSDIAKKMLDSIIMKKEIKKEEEPEEENDDEFDPSNFEETPKEQIKTKLKPITQEQPEQQIEEAELDKIEESQSIINEEVPDISNYYGLSDSELKKELFKIYPPNNDDQKENKRQQQRRYRLRKKIEAQKKKDLKGTNFEEDNIKEEVNATESEYIALVNSIIELQNKNCSNTTYTKEELTKMSKPTLTKTFQLINDSIEKEISSSVDMLTEFNIYGFQIIETVDGKIMKTNKVQGITKELKDKKQELISIYKEIVKEHPEIKKYISVYLKLVMLWASCYASSQGNQIINNVNISLNNPPILKKNP